MEKFRNLVLGNPIPAKQVFENAYGKNAIENIVTNNNHNQTIHQEFNITMPNINDASKADQLIREFEQLSTARVQYFNTRGR